MPTVLIVEDNADDRNAAIEAFDAAGWSSQAVATGRSALDIAARMTFDAIVADLRLPDLSAIEVLTQLRCASHTAPFVVVTAFGTVQDAVDALKSGASDFVQKPIPKDDLIRITAQAIGKERTPRPLAPGGGDAILISGVTDRRVRHALEVIRNEYVEPRLTLASLAHRVGISRFFLSKQIKRETGHTFLYHLHRRRTREAERLLIHSFLSIKEIAAQVGYERTSDLDRHFRRFFRATPTEYRHKHGD